MRASVTLTHLSYPVKFTWTAHMCPQHTMLQHQYTNRLCIAGTLETGVSPYVAPVAVCTHQLAPTGPHPHGLLGRLGGSYRLTLFPRMAQAKRCAADSALLSTRSHKHGKCVLVLRKVLWQQKYITGGPAVEESVPLWVRKTSNAIQIGWQLSWLILWKPGKLMSYCGHRAPPSQHLKGMLC